MTLDFFSEIDRITEAWKVAHPEINAAGGEVARTDSTRESGPEPRRADDPVDRRVGSETAGSIPAPAAPINAAHQVHPQRMVEDFAGRCAPLDSELPDDAAPITFADLQPTYWDEKKKDRREEFKREDAENHERAYPDREWEHK